MTDTKSSILNYVEAMLLISLPSSYMILMCLTIFALYFNCFLSLWNTVTGKHCSIKFTCIIGGLIIQGSTAQAVWIRSLPRLVLVSQYKSLIPSSLTIMYSLVHMYSSGIIFHIPWRIVTAVCPSYCSSLPLCNL